MDKIQTVDIAMLALMILIQVGGFVWLHNLTFRRAGEDMAFGLRLKAVGIWFVIEAIAVIGLMGIYHVVR